MFGDVWVEGRAALDAGAVVFDHFFEGREAAVVHIRRGQFDVAQGGRGEFSLIGVLFTNLRTAWIAKGGIESVIGERLAGEQWSAVTVEAISAELLPPRIVFG